jgi:hypothetical protein
VIILCVWLFGGYCVLLDLHLHHVAAFLTSYQLREILLEKERNADQAAAAEMRHMIGNVAHDLKTVRVDFSFFHLVISLTSISMYIHSLFRPSLQDWK